MKLWMRHFWPNLFTALIAFGVAVCVLFVAAKELPPITLIAMLVFALVSSTVLTWLDVRRHKRWAE